MILVHVSRIATRLACLLLPTLVYVLVCLRAFTLRVRRLVCGLRLHLRVCCGVWLRCVSNIALVATAAAASGTFVFLRVFVLN